MIDFSQLAMIALLGLLGFIAHILKTMKQAEATWNMSIFTYLQHYPKQTLAAFIGFVGLMVATFEMGQLNMTTAFACGYMANSAADMIAGRATKVMR